MCLQHKREVNFNSVFQIETHKHTQTHTRTHPNTHTLTHAHIHTHTRTHTHLHTHTLSLARNFPFFVDFSCQIAFDLTEALLRRVTTHSNGSSVVRVHNMIEKNAFTNLDYKFRNRILQPHLLSVVYRNLNLKKKQCC